MQVRKERALREPVLQELQEQVQVPLRRAPLQELQQVPLQVLLRAAEKPVSIRDSGLPHIRGGDG